MNLFEVYALQDIVIDHARGSFVWDKDGRKYLDFYGGHAVISVGHGHPHYVQRLKEQLDKISFYSNSVQMPLQHEFAEKLGRVSGKENYQLFLCNSGAEANENALKLASFHNGRKRIIAFSNSFHGRTSLAVAATDNPAIIAPVNENKEVVFLPFNDVEALEEYFQKNGDSVSSVITEGIQGVGGIREASVEFLKAVRKQCDAYGALYIADSVQCGYGRSGLFFSHDAAGVRADIYTMAKGMGNGFPIGGIIIAPHIKAVKGMLGTTFGGSYLACAAALAVLEIIEQEALMNNVADTGNYLIAELRKMPSLQNVRGRGLMIGFDVPEAKASLRRDLLYKHGIFTGEARPNVIRLLPPLTISAAEADLLLSALRKELASSFSHV